MCELLDIKTLLENAFKAHVNKGFQIKQKHTEPLFGDLQSLCGHIQQLCGLIYFNALLENNYHGQCLSGVLPQIKKIHITTVCAQITTAWANKTTVWVN